MSDDLGHHGEPREGLLVDGEDVGPAGICMVPDDLDPFDYEADEHPLRLEAISSHDIARE